MITQYSDDYANLVGAILISVKLSNVAHPVSTVVVTVSPQPTSDASIETASSTATGVESNATDHTGKAITYNYHLLRYTLHVRHTYCACKVCILCLQGTHNVYARCT